MGQDATARTQKHEWGEDGGRAGGCGRQQGQEIGSLQVPGQISWYIKNNKSQVFPLYGYK